MSEAPPLDYRGPTDIPFTPLASDFIEASVFARFCQVVERNASAIAVRDLEGALNYDQLMALVLRISATLTQQLSPGTPVAIALPIGRFYPAAMLGALAAGMPYVPLDLGFPAARLNHILTHAGATALVTDAAGVRTLGPMMPKGTQLIDIHTLPAPQTGFHPTAGPDDIAYIIYTSGSTGTPKGVFQNQRGLLHDVMQYINSIHLSERDRCTLLYSPSVNGAIRDIYGTLLTGATLCMFDLRRQGLRAVTEAIARWGVTIYHSIPPILRTLLRELPERQHLAGVRLAYVAGDRLFSSDVRLFRDAFPTRTLLYTGIGSTECATLYRQWFMPRDWPLDDTLPPVGYTIADRNMRLCDLDGNPVAAGEVGEIVVSSRFIARGYWNDPERTHSAFLSEPDQPAALRFRTGDLGRLREDGLLEFIGRADRQVKVRGYRVEPAEVEAVLRDLPTVTDAAVLAHDGDHGTMLTAYVVSSDPDLPHSTLDEAIVARLPAYMRPATINVVKQLPTLGNFKTDLTTLAKLNVASSPTDDLVAQAWRRALGHAPTENNQTFNEAGGDSLKALELHLALERDVGRRLPANLVEISVTAAQLRERLAKLGPAIQPIAGLSDLFIVPSVGKGSIKERTLASALENQFEVDVLEMPSIDKEFAKRHTLRTLGDCCVAQILEQANPGEKINVIGLSFGARTAYEAACRLREAGHPVGLLVIADISLLQRVQPDTRSSSKWSELSFRSRIRWQLQWWGGEVVARIHRCNWSFGRRLAIQAIMPLIRLFFSEAGARALLLFWLRKAEIAVWRPVPYAGPVLLLVTDDTRALFSGDSLDLGWRSLCPNLTVIDVPGNHGTFLDPPNIGPLVEAIFTYNPALSETNIEHTAKAFSGNIMSTNVMPYFSKVQQK
ncbi:MAG: AMP-binding protein [Pseudomonadota bacterium]